MVEHTPKLFAREEKTSTTLTHQLPDIHSEPKDELLRQLFFFVFFFNLRNNYLCSLKKDMVSENVHIVLNGLIKTCPII